MNFKKGMVLVAVGIVLLGFITSCVSGRAKIRRVQDITLQDIINDKDKYYIYYAGSSSRPIGVLVDLKDDDVKLVGDKWIRAEDEGTLSGLLDAVQGFTLNTIKARSDDKLFGYFSRTKYTERMGSYRRTDYNPLAKIVDENTVNVDLVKYVDRSDPIY
jgi:hypothetical protein